SVWKVGTMVLNILMKLLLLHCFALLMFSYVAAHATGELKLVRRDAAINNVRMNAHVRLLKYLSGRYKTLPIIEIADGIAEELVTNTTEESTTMEPYIIPTTTVSPSQINMNIFGGYFTSVLGNSLAHHFNVTSKIYTTPPYAMVHYYFHGDFVPPNNAFIGEANFINCGEVVNFCPPGSRQICVRNGTIYCATPISSSVIRPIDGLHRRCFPTNVKVQCRKEGLKTCEKMIRLHIPCYAIVTMVEGDECARERVYKDTYCILVIAYPLPAYSNSEFVEYLRRDKEGQRVVNHQFNNLAEAILKQIF
ncbi:hypothetical protein AMK59_2069, partial [Oryctes borbonicus]